MTGIHDPTRFVHLFIFENEKAHEANSQSDTVAAFEAVYQPVLVGGPVRFTDHVLVAAKMRARACQGRAALWLRQPAVGAL